MSIDVEYAIKKDIRNNPVIRELDTQQKREFRRIVWLAILAVSMSLFSAWHHFEVRSYSMRIEDWRGKRADEERINRQLRLNLETLRAPRQIESRARRELGLVTPSLADTLVVERARTSPPAPAVVALAR